MYKFTCIILFYFVLPHFVNAQQSANDSLRPVTANYEGPVVFKKPALFSFITHIPGDVAGFTVHSFKKDNLKNLALVVGSTAALYLADQMITNSIQSSSVNCKISANESFSPLLRVKIGGKGTNIGKVPKNVNTAFYDLGQGSSAMFMAAGFFILGEAGKSNRALQTASQLTEAFITLGVGTQLMKYATGRENPCDASVSRGRWRPFPSWSNFQNDKPRYDAFPSGHLATFVSAITIISNNYPEKKWIAPVGYSIAGLCGLSMINNGVHWASDFPLGFALGYGFGKFIAKKSHFELVP